MLPSHAVPHGAMEDPRVVRRPTRELVGLGRVELPTSRLSGVRSNHLSYRPLCTPPQAPIAPGAGSNPSIYHRAARRKPVRREGDPDQAGLRSLKTESCAITDTSDRRGKPS